MYAALSYQDHLPFDVFPFGIFWPARAQLSPEISQERGSAVAAAAYEEKREKKFHDKKDFLSKKNCPRSQFKMIKMMTFYLVVL